MAEFAKISNSKIDDIIQTDEIILGVHHNWPRFVNVSIAKLQNCNDYNFQKLNDYDQLLDWSYALQEKIIVLRHLAANNAPQINNYIKGEEAPKKELFVIEEQEKKEDIKPKEETHFQKIEV